MNLLGYFQRKIYSSSKKHLRPKLIEKENIQFLRIVSKYISKGGIVVDVGCGPGRFCELLCDQYPDLAIRAVDSIAGFLGKDRNNLRYFHADAESLLFQDESIDVVYMIDVLHHIKDREQAISEITRILKKDGMVIFRDIVNQGLFSNLKYRMIDLSCFYYSFRLPRYWNKKEWISKLKKHNLQLIEQEESTDGLKYLIFRKIPAG